MIDSLVKDQREDAFVIRAGESFVALSGTSSVIGFYATIDEGTAISRDEANSFIDHFSKLWKGVEIEAIPCGSLFWIVEGEHYAVTRS